MRSGSLASLAAAAPLAPLATVLGAVLATAACYREAGAPAAPEARPSRAATIDLGWPASLELEMVVGEDELKHRGLTMFSIDTNLPVFRSEPPAIGEALNARVARLAKPDADPRTYEGRYSIDCTVGVANRYAVLLDCERFLEQRTHDALDQGTGDVPEISTRVAGGWWLRRGLPELSLEQLAPHFDLRAAINAAEASQPAGCDLRSCAFDPRSFVIDGDGLVPIGTTECSPLCEGAIPSIPLDELNPTHAWARDLVRRVRRRVEAGDTLVEGERTR
jgi:hypothetical protein